MHKVVLLSLLTFLTLTSAQETPQSPAPQAPYSVEDAEKTRAEALHNLDIAENARQELIEQRDHPQNKLVTTMPSKQKTDAKIQVSDTAAKATIPKMTQKPIEQTIKPVSKEPDAPRPISATPPAPLQNAASPDTLRAHKKLYPLRANKCSCPHTMQRKKHHKRDHTFPQNFLYLHAR